MSEFHRFKLGQQVDLTAMDEGLRTRIGEYEIVRLMPRERGINQYRIRSLADGRERMVTEGELIPKLQERP
jgi:hypothetical protein